MDMSRGSLLRAALVDSPLPPSPLRTILHQSDEVSLSPMSGLAHHLGSTCNLNPPSPRRRLSLSSVVTGTPSPLHLRHRLLHDLTNDIGSDLSMTESPTVFKQSARISGQGSPPKSRCSSDVLDKENSPNKQPSSPIFSPTRMQIKSPLHRRRPPLDENSQDSGVGSDPSTFRFAAPLGLAPRNRNSPRKPFMLMHSPQREEMSVSPVHSPAARSSALFHSLSSGSESVDDGFLDFLALDKDDDLSGGNLPSGLGSLLSGEIMRTRTASPMRPSSGGSGRGGSAKRSLHRSLSMADTPVTSRARSCLFRSPSVDDVAPDIAAELRGGFKRPEPLTPTHSDMPPSKRRRENDSHEMPSAFFNMADLPLKPHQLQHRSLSAGDQSVRPRSALTQSSLLNYGFQRQTCISASPKSLQRSFSESEATIKKALQRSLTEPDLIGDFSQPFALPLAPGRHPDLKTINSSTLAQLLRGEFDHEVTCYNVIDCRYPYEYNGGHVRGSRNIYTKEMVSEVFISGSAGDLVPPRPMRSTSSTPGQGRHVLVFHCEFSSERAPSMSRHLRQLDRDANKECYPQLHYPEVYLLHGGYKAFYESYPDLCDPSGYVPMLSQGNEEDLRHFRAKSRSWTGDPRATVARLPPKFSLKRLDV